MRCCVNSKRGYSLIELLAAALAASVLALTAGTMLFHAYGAWNDNHAAVNVHRDARHAMDMLTRAVRAASRSQIVTAENNNLVIDNVVGAGTTRFWRAERDLMYDPDTAVSGDDKLVKDAITTFTVSSTATAITIQLRLDRDGEALLLDSVTAFRN
jgi:prepilin-type N-terminal cleavage/methylation domain-containing protein